MSTDLEARAREEIATDTLKWAPKVLRIIPKKRSRGLIPLEPNDAQIGLEKLLAKQRAAGKPQRAVILKCRRAGMSTWVQAKLILAATQRAHISALVVAHDVDTGGKLFNIGQRMYASLPGEDKAGFPLKPEVKGHRRSRFIHFGTKGQDAWETGDVWPDSTYWVDTASEFESGRGGEYHEMHLSEYAFWPQPEQKFTALMQAVPEEPDTMIVIESTANGHNHFKDLWDNAVEGHSEFAPFFWPWWKQAEYTRPFVNEAERREFRIGDTDQSPFAEDEPDLVEPGPFDLETGEPHPLTLEQLNWRRWWIANRTGGKIDKFQQEMPATPEEAFLATGRKVFEPQLVSLAMRRAEQTDPRMGGEGGPVSGTIRAGSTSMEEGRFGEVRVPNTPTFIPARELGPHEDRLWRFWLPFENGKLIVPRDAHYVIGGDVSEGISETEDEEAETAFHALIVIDHKTREQVAEYRSRVDPDLFAQHALLAAKLFNDAWLIIERTGPGRQVVRTLRHDFHWPFLYRMRHHATDAESQGKEFGWDTTRRTKPILLALGAELLREGTHGIKSRRLASEMMTYVRLGTGKTVPERGRFADLLMAYLIGQQGAEELPVYDDEDEDEELGAAA